MTASRRRSRRRGGVGGWLAAALGLGALAVIGFSVGVLAGVAWEDPGLLASHLLGGTEEVAWGPGPPGPAGERARPAPAEAAMPRPRSPAPTAPAVAARPPEGRFAIQVGAFGESAAAERLAESLRRKGFAAYVSPGLGDRDARWRVRVGPLASREEADRTAARLKKAERLPTWVLSEDGG